MRTCFTTLLICLGLAACAGIEKVSESSSLDDGLAAFQKPLDYIPSALGPHTWSVTSANTVAQNYFNQGLQLRYAYSVDDAARSFREARLADPVCAMCFWGEAFALGAFLNGGMTAEKAPFAHQAIEKAVELSASASEMERDLIMAARNRYPAEFNADNAKAINQAFAERMKPVYEKYPDHHDVAVVYAVALFLLEERRGRRDVEAPDLIRLHGVLTDVLAENIAHPGACHLYIHATESSQKPELALECAEYLSDAIPVASHIQHMPSHTWNEVGYWDKSVRANITAYQSDLKSRKNQGFAYATMHNLHMLLFAASMDGQSAIAMQAGRDYAKETGNSMYQALTLLRFGRYDEIPDVTLRPDGGIEGGFWDFAQGYAALKNGDENRAQRYLKKLQDLAADSEAVFRFHDAEHLMGLSAAILEGEIHRTNGEMDEAIAAFRRAVMFDDEQPYDEPEPIPYAARHWLGAALLETEQYAEAEQEYRTELADHPHNVWSLHGLKIALTAQGKTDAEVDTDYLESSARMDAWITSSIF